MGLRRVAVVTWVISRFEFINEKAAIEMKGKFEGGITTMG